MAIHVLYSDTLRDAMGTVPGLGLGHCTRLKIGCQADKQPGKLAELEENKEG
jgi:hypothetical protein